MNAITTLTTAAAMLALAVIGNAMAQDDSAQESGGQGMMGEGMMGQGGGQMMGQGMMGERGGMMGRMMRGKGKGEGPAAMCGKMIAHIDGRLAFLKAELKITPEQESLWNDYATAVRDNAKTMTERCTAMMEKTKDQPLSLPERLDNNEKFIEARLEALRTVGKALKPLYAALSDTQKEIADQMIKGSTGTL